MKLRLTKLVLCFFLCFSTLLNAQEGLLNKKFSISETDISISDVIAELENSLDFTATYSNNIVDLSKKITLDIEEGSLQEILKIIFPSKLYRFKVLGKKLLIYKRPQRYTVNGYVSEKGSQEYLGNVSVYALSQSTGAITNDYGFYSLTLPEGKHKLLLSYVGYKSIKKEIDLTKNLDLNFELEVDLQELEEVVISSDEEQPKSQVTQMSSNTITSGLVDEIPAILGEKDVIKTLQLLPGIQSGSEGGAGFYVRGGAPDQNLIILDESIVYNTNHLFGIFSIFNGDAIRTVEIFKGGFPASYGGRLSSVVKINTKNGNKEKLHGRFNLGLISSSFLLEGPIKKNKTSFVLSGRRTYLDLLVRPFIPKDADADGGYNFSDINTKLHHVFDDKNKLYWSTYFGEDKFFGENDDSALKIKWGNVTSTLRWNHEFNDKLFSNTSLIFSNYRFVTDIFDSTDNLDNNTFYVSGINDYSIKQDFNYYPNPKHSLKFGLLSIFHDFRPARIVINDGLSPQVTNTLKIQTWDNALFIEDDWEVSSKFRLNPGIRLSYFQHRSKSYIKPELRFASLYNLKPTLGLKFSYSKMNQFIHRLSNTGIGLPTDLWVSSSDQIKPQISEQVALGIAKDFGTNNEYEATIETYYKKMDDIIELKEGASIVTVSEFPDIDGSIQNVDFVEGITTGQGWAYGSEFLLRKKTGKLKGWLGYTLSWSERQFDELNAGKKFNDRYDRRHDISLVTSYTFDRRKKPHKKTTLSANWVYSSGINYNLPNNIGINPQTDFPINIPNPTFTFNTERNNLKGEDFHRLVLGVQFHKTTKRKNERIWGWSFYNMYLRKNPFFYNIEQVDEIDQNGDQTFTNTLVRYNVFQFVPSFNYTFKF